MSDTYGPDGWRKAYVIFATGRRWLSRKDHYFKNGVSLCGTHNDRIINKFTTYARKRPDYEHSACKKCLKKALKKAEAVN